MGSEQVKTAAIRKGVAAAEWQMRVDLAACYRLIAQYGWDDLIFTHVSGRVPGADDHFLLNPFGMLFEEITASCLLKVDLAGHKVTASEYDINPAGFTIHSAVHEARSESRCVIHLHSPAGVAVSCQQAGLLPISQHAATIIGRLAYHDYEGFALDAGEKGRLIADLGTHNSMILRNHGLLTCGETVGDAFLRMYQLERACRVQVMAQGGGELIRVPQTIIDEIGAITPPSGPGLGARLLWPALLRRLDRTDPGYRD